MSIFTTRTAFPASALGAVSDTCNKISGPVSARCQWCQDSAARAHLPQRPAYSSRNAARCDAARRGTTGPHAIALPRGQQKLAFTLEHVLSDLECEELMRAAEAIGFGEAGLGGAGQQEVNADVRSSGRLISEDPLLAGLLWGRVRSHVPLVWRGRPVLGLNEQLKFLRYTEGQHFAAHVDGAFRRPGTANVTCLTVQLYLNRGALGGATRFLGGYSAEPGLEGRRVEWPDVDCAPVAGRALVFQHDILHAGAVLEGGVKYTIRTDVEYGPESARAYVQALAGLGGAPEDVRRRLGWAMAGLAAAVGVVWVLRPCRDGAGGYF